MTQTFMILGKLAGLNEIIDAAKKHRFKFEQLKNDARTLIRADIRRAKIKAVAKPCQLVFTWIEPDKRRDLDNIAAAKKFIIDALRDEKILPNDGWVWVRGFSDGFTVCKEKPGVIVSIVELEEEA